MLWSRSASMGRYLELAEAVGRLSRQPDEALLALLEFTYSLGGCLLKLRQYQWMW